ncbi:MAG: tetratricopeptide repeat protein [Planctomycetota bacterium]
MSIPQHCRIAGGLVSGGQVSGAIDKHVEAAIALGEAQYRASDFSEAVKTLRQAVDQARGITDASLPWKASLQLANALQLVREMDEAGLIYDRLLREIREGRVVVSAPDAANAQIGSGVLMHKRGMPEAGIERVDAGIAILEQSVGENHPSWTTAVHNRAVLLMAGGDLEGARDGLSSAVEAWRRLVGPDHVNTLNAMIQLGDVQRRLGDMDAAQELLKQAVPAVERTLGPSTRLTLKGIQDLAELYAARGEWPEALAHIDRVAQIHTDFSGEDDPRTWYARAQRVQYAGEAGQAVSVITELRAIEREAIDRFGSDNRFARAIRRMRSAREEP